MEPEKTLLQQIREKEQEYAKRLDDVKKEVDLSVESARSDAEALLCTADGAGKAEAERLYWEGKAKTETEIGELKRAAAAGQQDAEERGRKNLSRAIDAITGYVTMR